MIVFDLECRGGGHRFEGWFGSSDDFAEQQQRGLIACPQCGSSDVIKAPMAPNVSRKTNQLVKGGPASSASTTVAGGQLLQALAALQAVAAMQREALKDSRWVGEGFADVSREIHYGEREAETIHGQATPQEALDLLEEGIEVMPLPFPVAPGETN